MKATSIIITISLVSDSDELAQSKEEAPVVQPLKCLSKKCRKPMTRNGNPKRLHVRVKCDTCELEYVGEHGFHRHLKTFFHEEGVNSRRIGTNGEARFVCDCCQLEFVLLGDLVSHKKTCEAELHSETGEEIQAEVDPAEDEELKPVVVNMEFDLLESEERQDKQESSLSPMTVQVQSSMVVEIETAEVIEEYAITANGRPQRASRLVAEAKLQDLTKSEDIDVSIEEDEEDSSDFECSQTDSETDSEENEEDTDEEMDETQISIQDGATYSKLGNTKIYKCSRCGSSFSNRALLLSHKGEEKLHNMLRQRAEKLGISIFSISVQQETGQPAPAPDPLICQKCWQKFPDIAAITSHRLLEAGDKYKCELCDLSFCSETRLARHLSSELHLQSEHRQKVSDTKNGENVPTLPTRDKESVLKVVKQQNFSCHTCNKHYKTAKSLRVHVRRHKIRQTSQRGENQKSRKSKSTAPDPLICEKCWQKFPDIEAITSHKLRLSSDQYKCELCDLSYCSEILYERHFSSALHLQWEQSKKMSENGVVTFVCDQCHEIFELLSDLISHKRELHPKGEFYCEPCNKPLGNCYSFSEHLLTPAHVKSLGEEAVRDFEQQKKFSCDSCPKKFITAAMLRKHTKQHARLRESGHVCEKCGQKCRDYSALQRHLATHKDPSEPNGVASEKLVKCPKCPKLFLDESRMSRHSKKCGTRVTCHLCFKHFEGWSSLQTHQRFVHNFGKKKTKPSAKVESTCDICSRTFASKEGLVRHVELGHFPDQKRCPYGCSDKIENIEEWKHHLENCTSEKLTEQSRCSCFYCGLLFRTRLLQLEHHLRLHKTYSCGSCSRGFTQADTLRVHQIEHKDLKRHLCPKCGRSYGSVSSFKSHSATVCGDDAGVREEILRRQREYSRNSRMNAPKAS